MRTKYKIMLAIITVGIGICLMTYQSYALWVANHVGGENIVNVGCFSIEFQEQTNPISLNNTYPVSDAKGLTSTPYTFTIKNTCTVDAAYDVTLNTITTNTMNKNWIKYAIHKSTETKPTTGTNLGTNNNYNTATEELKIAKLDDSIIIASGSLKQDETVTYNFYLWMDETTGNEAMNTRFEGSINVISSATEIIPTAADIILAKGETDELKFDNTTDNNLRYVGSNPNNYVSFNNELWRIIGVFNNIDDGTGKKETRLKIIRNEPYSVGIAWDSNNIDDWTTSSLQKELNGSYLNSIQSSSKDMIGNTKWQLGGLNDYYTPKAFYDAERGTDVYSGRPTEWIGKVGLMYPSDYGYATSGSQAFSRENCLATKLGSFSQDCYSNDWLYNSSYHQWTLTHHVWYPFSVFYVQSSGTLTFGQNVTWNGVSASPTLYLSSNVKISGGDGSEVNPYTLSL